jgi:hypothetical protein|nr:MAG TPA: hypothetical protein [Caudoviricetes sp.]
MKIKFNKNYPEKNYYRIGVCDNNLVDNLIFELDVIQENVDLTSFQAFLKLISLDGTYADKIKLSSEVDQQAGKIILNTLLTDYATSSCSVDCQLEFDYFDGEDETLIWQTSIFNITFEETLNVDEKVKKKFPNVIVDFEKRIDTIEKNKPNLIKKKSVYDFPNIGQENCIYIATDENKTYHFDSSQNHYVIIGSNYEEIEIIDGNTSLEEEDGDKKS